MRRVPYARVRPDLRTNDLVFFWGRGLISGAIRLRQFFQWPPWAPNPSHVGVVWRVPQERSADDRVWLVESTSLDGIQGVAVTYLSERLRSYRGTLAVGRIRDSTPQEWQRGREYLGHQIGKAYDTWGALGAGLTLVHNAEDPDTLFCSELAAFNLRYIGRLPSACNPSEQTPKHVTRYPFLHLLERITP